MKNILQNKKMLIPIIIFILVIVIAIIFFVLIGSANDNSSTTNTISLGNNTSEESGSENETENEVENEAEYEDLTEEVDVDSLEIDEGYKNALKQFLLAYTDEEEMQYFIDNYVETHAFVAYGNVEMDDEGFMEEYQNLDDDEAIDELIELLLQVPSTINASEAYFTDVSEVTVSEYDENISSISFDIYSSNTDEDNNSVQSYSLDMYFYNVDGTYVVIYIADTFGEPITSLVTDTVEE